MLRKTWSNSNSHMKVNEYTHARKLALLTKVRHIYTYDPVILLLDMNILTKICIRKLLVALHRNHPMSITRMDKKIVVK